MNKHKFATIAALVVLMMARWCRRASRACCPGEAQRSSQLDLYGLHCR